VPTPPVPGFPRPVLAELLLPPPDHGRRLDDDVGGRYEAPVVQRTAPPHHRFVSEKDRPTRRVLDRQVVTDGAVPAPGVHPAASDPASAQSAVATGVDAVRRDPALEVLAEGPLHVPGHGLALRVLPPQREVRLEMPAHHAMQHAVLGPPRPVHGQLAQRPRVLAGQVHAPPPRVYLQADRSCCVPGARKSVAAANSRRGRDRAPAPVAAREDPLPGPAAPLPGPAAAAGRSLNRARA